MTTSTIHDKIDNYLAADLHGELSAAERDELHTHLVDCPDCRKLHQETKLMNKVLEENLATEKADGAFEQRMLAGFRNRIPLKRRGGLPTFVVDLMRLRATQIAAVAAVLLALLQVGRMITHEPLSTRPISAFGRDEANEFAARDFKEEQTSQLAKADKAPKPAAPLLAGDLFGERESAMQSEAAGTKAKAATALAAPQEQRADDELKDQTESVSATAGVPAAQSSADASPAMASHKIIRNAQVDLEIVKFDEAAQKIAAFAAEEKGYIATSSSEKQQNGKLRGEIVAKILPENLDRFLQKIGSLGELKNQTIGSEDITKAYFDTDARLKNARVMESRLIEMLKRKSDDINDLLQVEKELGRVREEIEKMQGELKFWDSQVAFATVTIQLAEKDLEEAAKYLLKERAQLALYTPEVEKVYNDIKALASPKVQITNAQLDRDNGGRVSARVSMLIAPEESDAVIAKTKAMGRVENFQVQSERVAQGGEGMSENATTKRDKVQLNITVSRDEQEQAVQQTSLSIRTNAVDEKSKALRELVEKQNGRVRNSAFSRDPNGREFANVQLRLPLKNYNALMQSLDSLGKVENVTVQRQNREDVDLANAPADLSIQVYSPGNIVARESGLFATLRRTLAQSAAAIMWSLRMIGVAIAFIAPWIAAIVGFIWIAKRIRRRSK
jgi:hypothetical protein